MGKPLTWLALNEQIDSSTTKLLLVTMAALAKEEKGKPNVVLIFSDDMGYSDLPKFGKSEIPTPNIDRLAHEGTLSPMPTSPPRSAWPHGWAC